MTNEPEPTRKLSEQAATALLRMSVTTVIGLLQRMQERGSASMLTFGLSGGLKECEDELVDALDRHRERRAALSTESSQYREQR
jgi:hypothetical protein